MADHPAMHNMRALYGQPRDSYQGTTPPPVADAPKPVRVIHMRRSGNCVLLAIAEGNQARVLRVSNPDDPRLLALTSDDRSRVCSALSAIGREQGDANDAA